MARTQTQNSTYRQLVSIRESVESLWIAIILAFILRAFIIEAFVIPTGSMAPRLMGQHWQFDCPACGYHYAFGLPSSKNPNIDLSEPKSGPPAMCPNCLYHYDFRQAWAYNGDRVLVLKYLYRFKEPSPWDVVVFKNPQDNETNFIKRLIGLPGEMIQIVHGDVYYCQLNADLNGDGAIDGKDFADSRQKNDWKILRKPPRTQEVMWQIIFENDYQPDETLYKKTGDAWKSPWHVSPDSAAWDLSANSQRVFKFAGAAKPQSVEFQGGRNRFAPNYAYNGSAKAYDQDHDVSSDLKLSFMFVPQAAESRIGLHLSSYQHHFRGTLSADGQCVLEHGLEPKQGTPEAVIEWDEKPWGSESLEPLKAGSSHTVALAHVDHMVQFWVDGQIRIQTTDSQYPANMQEAIAQEARGVPTPTVEITAQGGPSELWHIDLMRDVYYTQVRPQQDIPDTPRWGTTGRPIILRKFLNNPDKDEFFVLGDNSPLSADSRMWGGHSVTMRDDYHDGTVPRYSMIGRAFFVYWPGGFRFPLLDKLPPLIPNVGRMRFIR